MTIRTVEVYRLWADGHWDKTSVEVLSEPWTMEIVEARATQKAWWNIHKLSCGNSELLKPIQIGLYMPSFQEQIRG